MKTEVAILQFGIRNDKVFHIKDVPSGLSCNLDCSKCGDKLVAKKGRKQTHHFAHYKVENCVGALESVLHKLSKKILETHGYLTIPGIQLKIGTKHDLFTFYEKSKVEFDSIVLEKKQGSFIPDLIATKNGKKILIEIGVTHFIDDEKKQKIFKEGISTLEIDLSEYKEGISKSELKSILLNSTKHKKWVYNSKLEKIKRLISDEQNRKVDEYDFEGRVITRRWHMNCPLTKNGFASYSDNCSNCIHNIKIYSDNIFGGKLSVFCSAKNNEQIWKIIKEMKKPISNNVYENHVG